MVEIPKSWKVRSLRVWGVDMYDIQKHFPETIKLLNEISCVVNIGFNLLEPDAKIKELYKAMNYTFYPYTRKKICSAQN